MGRILISLLLLISFNASAQKLFFAQNFTAPVGGSNVSIAGTPNFQFNNTGGTSHSLTSVPAGALIVVTAACGSGTSLNSVVASTPTLTWTKRVDATYGENSGDAEIYTATYTAGGSITVTSNYGSGNAQSSVAYVIINQETTPSGAQATAANQSLPDVTITTTRTNSIIIACTADWSAASGASRVYRISPTETGYDLASGAYTAYHYYKAAVTVTNYTMGLTVPNMSSGASTALYEIRGN